MHDFKKIIAWRKSMDLVKDIYAATSNFPKTEIYGLTNQIRRSSISIPSNIAEGSGRGMDKDFRKFLHTAYGSSCELESQLMIAIELEFSKQSEVRPLFEKITEIQKMLHAWIEKFS
jgi:four helix bundle protein